MEILQRRMPATFSLPHALLLRLNSEVSEGRRSLSDPTHRRIPQSQGVLFQQRYSEIRRRRPENYPQPTTE